MTAPTERSVSPTIGRSWLWPPRPFTIVVVGCVLAIGFLANIPAVDVPHANVRSEGKYGMHFEIVPEYEHGWPARYARRDLSLIDTGQPATTWRPWQGVRKWSMGSLLVDVALWGVLILIAGIAAQYWRSRRKAVWQVDLRDLLAFTGVVGLLCAWIAVQRFEIQKEVKLLADHRARGHGVPDAWRDAPVPLWLPLNLQDRYEDLFGRVYGFNSDGDTDLACQFHCLVRLAERNPRTDMADHLCRMPQLEALDLCFADLPYFDATEQTTILSDLPPMPNLRGINLYETNATDADMAWLAACPRLEVIDLGETDIGDHGLAQLAELPRLRRLTISSDRISDRGCQMIGAMSALEELELASRYVQDAGLQELARLRNLKRLQISASTTDAGHDSLRRALPKCEFEGNHYRASEGR